MSQPAPQVDPKSPKTDNTDNRTDAGASLNSPKVDPKTGKATQRAVSSFPQAHGICKNLYQRAREGRLWTAATIRENYDGRAPFREEDMRKTGQRWRNNWSTQNLASIVDRVKPQFMDPIQDAGVITFSKLPPDIDDGAEKSNKFRKVITKTIRAWQGWPDFLSLLTQEEILHGNACPGWIDPTDWRPRMYLYDHVFLPEGTWQHSSKAALVVFAQEILLYQFLQIIQDPESAKDAGYDIEGCVKAANEAAGLEAKGELTPLEQQDRIREQGTFGASYDTAVKNVDLYHLLVVDYSGEVDLWTVSQKTGHAVRHVEGIYSSFTEAASFFTFQTGNGKFYGSKGLGRLITNLHIAIERNRCFAYDSFYLSQLPIAKGAEQDIKRAQFTVKFPFLLMPAGIEIVKESVNFDVEGFMAMDEKLVSLEESIAGAFIPPNIDQGGAPNTKIEAAQKAEREMAVRQGVLGRFFGQIADLVGTMQQKICSVDNCKEALHIFRERQKQKKKGFRLIAARLFDWLKSIIGASDLEKAQIDSDKKSKIADEDAVSAILELLEAELTMEEIGMLALCPAGNSVEENADEEDQKMIALIQQKIEEKSPYFDQKKMAQVQAETMVGEDRAALILRNGQYDPSDITTQTNRQIMEMSEMINGNYMGVSGDDIHAIHREAMSGQQGGKLDGVMQALTGALNPQLVAVAQFFLSHYSGHLSMDDTLTDADRMAESQKVEAWAKLLKQAQTKLAAEVKKAAQQQGQPQPGASPSPLGQQQPQFGPDGNVIPGQANGAMTSEGMIILAADMAMHKDNIAIKTRQLDLQEQKQNHEQQMDLLGHTTDAQKSVATAAADAQRQGMEDAAREQQQADAQQAQLPQA